MKKVWFKTSREVMLEKAEKTNTRLCEAGGLLALFHRWVEEDKALLHCDTLMPGQEHRARLVEFKRDGIVYPDYHTEVVRQTFALVELLDGTVQKVEPTKVRFLDK